MTDRTSPVTETPLPCPFCGSPSEVEEVGMGSADRVSFTVGCASTSEDACMGYQCLQTFPSRKDAIAAWNKRAPRCDGFAQTPVEHRCVEGRENLLLIAHEIREAKRAYLDGYGQVGNAARKEKLSQVLHDDATTIADALEALAVSSTLPSAPSVSASHNIGERDPSVMPGSVGADTGCICQDQHRRGHCTEPGCPHFLQAQKAQP